MGVSYCNTMCIIYNQDTLTDGILSRPGGYELWLFPLHCLLNNSRRHEVGHKVSDQHQNSSDRHLFSSSFFPTIMLCGFVWPLEGMPYPWLRFVIQCCCWCPTHGEGCFQTKSFTCWISGRLCGIFHRPQGCRSHICDNILFHNLRRIPSTVKILNATNHFEVVVASWKSHPHPI